MLFVVELARMINSIWLSTLGPHLHAPSRPTPIPIYGPTCILPIQPSPCQSQQLPVVMLNFLLSYPHQLTKMVKNQARSMWWCSCGVFVILANGSICEHCVHKVNVYAINGGVPWSPPIHISKPLCINLQKFYGSPLP